MIHLIFQKMLHKKWMMLSLLIGNILLIAIATSYPMFRDASLVRMLSEEFREYTQTHNEDPAMFEITGKIRFHATNDGYNFAYQKQNSILQELGLEGGLALRHSSLLRTTANRTLEREGAGSEVKFLLGTMEDLPSHAEVISGEMYSDSILEGNVVEAVVTVNTFVGLDVLVGEVLECKFLEGADGKPLFIKIVGVIAAEENSAGYWIEEPDSFTQELLISSQVFDTLFINKLQSELNTTWYVRFNADSVEYNRVRELCGNTVDAIATEFSNCEIKQPAYMTFLPDFLINEKKIEATLLILQVPVLVLLCAFLFMISSRMFSMEQNEISVMTSRGAGPAQIIMMYLFQAVFISGISLAAGLPLGSLLCRVIGSANAFLQFVQREALHVRLTVDVFLYAAAAMVISVMMSVLPALLGVRVTIVGAKNANAKKRKPLWQKLFVDVLLLGISIYGYFNFERQKDRLSVAVLQGDALDPLLYLSSSLFILGCALFTLRVIPLLVRLIYSIGKKHWKPALFASFNEMLYSGSKQYFIMAFLVLTVSLGIFNTTVARTIAANNESNLSYLAGADITLREVWDNNLLEVAINPEAKVKYVEPDFYKYKNMEAVDSAARVYYSEKAYVDNTSVTVMGINTKEFGETTMLPEGLLAQHYYSYLNELSVEPGYLLVSSSFRDVMGYKVGDRLNYRVDDFALQGVIADFVDYFPGFDPENASFAADGSVEIKPRYLVVAHLSALQTKMGIRPYMVWLKLKDGAVAEEVYSFITENNIKVAEFNDLERELTQMRANTLFKGTNGILTLSFMVILLLCIIGYIIYWTLTMQSRELMMGILRAMGMSKNEIFGMLINEQIYSSVLPLAAGAGIGILASRLFVPLIQIAYSASDQVIPLRLVTEERDMVRLFVIIGVMFLLSLIILVRQILRMKITQALKLGED